MNFPDEWEGTKILHGRKRKVSKYRGVYRSTNNNKSPWGARIRIVHWKLQHLGLFATEEQAARAYDAEGAGLGREVNFPDEWADAYIGEEKNCEKKGEEENEEEMEEDRGGGAGSGVGRGEAGGQ